MKRDLGPTLIATTLFLVTPLPIEAQVITSGFSGGSGVAVVPPNAGTPTSVGFDEGGEAGAVYQPGSLTGLFEESGVLFVDQNGIDSPLNRIGDEDLVTALLPYIFLDNLTDQELKAGDDVTSTIKVVDRSGRPVEKNIRTLATASSPTESQNQLPHGRRLSTATAH